MATDKELPGMCPECGLRGTLIFDRSQPAGEVLVEPDLLCPLCDRQFQAKWMIFIPFEPATESVEDVIHRLVDDVREFRQQLADSGEPYVEEYAEEESLHALGQTPTARRSTPSVAFVGDSWHSACDGCFSGVTVSMIAIDLTSLPSFSGQVGLGDHAASAEDSP